jgi:hypothetical protein
MPTRMFAGFSIVLQNCGLFLIVQQERDIYTSSNLVVSSYLTWCPVSEYPRERERRVRGEHGPLRRR